MALTDERLKKLHQERQDYKRQIAALNAKIEKNDAKILKELQRRGVKEVTYHDGYKVGMAQGKSTKYDFEAIMAEIGPAKARRLQKRVIDPKLVMQAIGERKISAALVAQHTTVTDNAPYVTGTS